MQLGFLLVNDEIGLLVSSVLKYRPGFQNRVSGDSFDVCWPTDHMAFIFV